MSTRDQVSLLLPKSMTAYFNNMKQGALPSPDSLQAHISMILKTTVEAHDPQVFRPISLLNEDMKLLGKSLCYLCSLIHRDHVGFVSSRQAGDNVQKVVHLISLLHHRKILFFFLSLNIYKAFDCLSWDFVLQRWGFGDLVLTWLITLYSSPPADVGYAACLSSPSPEEHGRVVPCLLFFLSLPLSPWPWLLELTQTLMESHLQAKITR